MIVNISSSDIKTAISLFVPFHINFIVLRKTLYIVISMKIILISKRIVDLRNAIMVKKPNKSI